MNHPRGGSCHRDNLTWLCFEQMEMKRLSLQHHISILTLNGKLHFSPIKEDGKILDLGTGNGIFKKNPTIFPGTLY